MSKEIAPREGKVLKPMRAEEASGPAVDGQIEVGGVLGLQQTIGNRAVQRMLAQRDDASLQLDEETAGRIDEARAGGQGLDAGLQEQMGAALGHDLSAVQVHTDSGADTLSRELNAEAFTTGQDVFFRQGAYDPGSDSGRELIAHELTHVVQQGAGAVSSTQGMTVNPPGDVFEQEADSVAQQVANAARETGSAGSVAGAAQRQAAPEEEEIQARHVQRQEVPEEEEIQAREVQRQEMPEDEEIQAREVQRQELSEDEEEDELVQPKAVQRQKEMPEEEL